MSITISKTLNNCVEITVSGLLLYKDLQVTQEAAKKTMNAGVKVNCLILADQFTGWGKDGDWGDLTFMYESDPLIGKIAVVAQGKHKNELLMFLGADRRQAAVKYFSPNEGDHARNWLAEPVE